MLIAINATMASVGTDSGFLQVVYKKLVWSERAGLPRCSYGPKFLVLLIELAKHKRT